MAGLIHGFIHSPFNGSGGFCTTIKIKSSSGATKISCFLLLILRYVSSLAGSKSLTIDLALSDSCDINTEYWNVSMNVRYMTLKCITLKIRSSGSIFVYEMKYESYLNFDNFIGQTCKNSVPISFTIVSIVIPMVHFLVTMGKVGNTENLKTVLNGTWIPPLVPKMQ